MKDFPPLQVWAKNVGAYYTQSNTVTFTSSSAFWEIQAETLLIRQEL